MKVYWKIWKKEGGIRIGKRKTSDREKRVIEKKKEKLRADTGPT